MLVDCGATALAALKRERLDPASIGCVALSHLHGDHFGGLVWLIIEGRMAGRSLPLVIGGPPTTAERLARASEALYPGSGDAEAPFEVRHLAYSERQRCEVGPALVTPFEVVHSSGAPAYALRIEYADKVITYSGDTEWTDNLLEAARNADVFVCECNFFDTSAPGHLNFRTLERKRDALECRRLVLTHMADEMLDRVSGLGVEAAADGCAIDL
jgi:ribonuclease BN (tRNA processing enzyme)